jgi:pimeloyl-ACP methyl ester carboxylesterase
MGPTGLPVIMITIALALGAPVVTVLTWDLPRLRLVRRVGMLLLCQVLTLVAGLALVNRAGDFYTSWNELINTGTPTKVVTGPNVANLVGLPRQVLRRIEPHVSPFSPLPASPSHAPPEAAAGPGKLDHSLAHLHGSRSKAGSIVLQARIRGPRTRYDLPALLYLPAEYFQPSFAGTRFPVVEFLAGYPGSAHSWTGMLRLQKTLDQEIAAGRMAPTVGVLPAQNPRPPHDSECVDAVGGGSRAGTYLGEDVPDVVGRELRVRTDAAGWAVMGYSTGGFCAVNLVLRHPHRFLTAVSLAGYFHPITDSTTGDLYRKDRHARDLNDPRYLVRHQPPEVWMYLAASGGDEAAVRQIHEFVPLIPDRVHTTVAMLPVGGHNPVSWRVLERAAYRWLKDTVGHSTVPAAT